MFQDFMYGGTGRGSFDDTILGSFGVDFLLLWIYPFNSRNWHLKAFFWVKLNSEFNAQEVTDWTAENVGKHLKPPDIILRTTEDPL